MEPLFSSSARLLNSRASQPMLSGFGRTSSMPSSTSLIRSTSSHCASYASSKSFASVSTSSFRGGAFRITTSDGSRISSSTALGPSPSARLTKRWASTKAPPPPPAGSSAGSSSSGKKEGQGKMPPPSDATQELVIFRGPAPGRPWIYFLGGTFFFISGLSIASVVQDHLTWPLWGSRDADKPRELLAPWKRKLAAGGVFFLGSALGWLFWIVPSKSVTRLTLRPAERELIIRTASPGLVNLFPRFLLRGPFRRVAQVSGFQIMPRRDERVVPLDSVYRIYGSAVGAGWGSAKAKRPSSSSASSTAAAQPQKKVSLQLIVGRERLFYSVEAAGGADPSIDPSLAKRGLYARGYFNLVHSLRGYTDWRDAVEPGQSEEQVRKEAIISSGPASAARPVQYRKLGDKEPWFLNRRNFDELLPLVLRR